VRANWKLDSARAAVVAGSDEARAWIEEYEAVARRFAVAQTAMHRLEQAGALPEDVRDSWHKLYAARSGEDAWAEAWKKLETDPDAVLPSPGA
jgi:hypothetical protein